jgi:hypothetical protein
LGSQENSFQSFIHTINAADPFVMQYADGFPLDRVAWGRLTLDQLSQQTRMIRLFFDIEMLSSYLNQVQSSNAASHVLRTMEQAVISDYVPGAFGDARSRMAAVISSDSYMRGSTCNNTASDSGRQQINHKSGC